jgi:alpha-amylase
MEQQVQMYKYKMGKMQMQIRQLTLQLELQAHTAEAASRATASSSSSATTASSTTTETANSSDSSNSSSTAVPTVSDSDSSSTGSNISSSKPYPLQTTVTFSVTCPTAFGQRVWLVGDAAALGSWDVSRGLALTWTEGGNWVGSVDLDAAATTAVQYKAVLEYGPGGYKWASGENWQLALTAASHSVAHKFA